ncbi:drug/metabolite transporter (DMT)-like permease [Leucobacter exalbidus]|uniref:Drug/metabolite transporter (DMT)-like permease n=1 Tax=Leucobacter exalbidus TaxID=662960 RepID=A0A940PWM4_9MICO|nr:EamA family transporter [Leucobacter exalbidus]MBP1327590.1 drug/metabolite transporter (DMT)-like permease [Leucobacter exalbidus]
MSTTAFVLVFAAAFAHAAWNIIAHGSSRTGLPFLWWGSLISMLMWVGVIPFTGGFGAADLRGFLAGAGVSAVLHVAYMLVLQRGYTVGDLSTVYATARGTGPMLTVLIAVLFLGERPAPLALLGVAVLVCGIVAIGFIGRPLHTDMRTPTRKILGMDPGLFYGLVTGVAIATYTIWDTHALREWGATPVAFMVGCLALEIPIYTLVIWKRRGELMPTLREQWKRLIAFGFFSPLSYILVLTAVTIAPVSLVAPVREVSVVLVSLFGAIVFKEHRPVARVAASVVVVGGVVLLSIG